MINTIYSSLERDLPQSLVLGSNLRENSPSPPSLWYRVNIYRNVKHTRIYKKLKTTEFNYLEPVQIQIFIEFVYQVDYRIAENIQKTAQYADLQTDNSALIRNSFSGKYIDRHRLKYLSWSVY